MNERARKVLLDIMIETVGNFGDEEYKAAVERGDVEVALERLRAIKQNTVGLLSDPSRLGEFVDSLLATQILLFAEGQEQIWERFTRGG